MVELRDPEAPELKSNVRSGLVWKLFSEGSIFGSRLAVSIILAHLLSPKDFGIAGMALVLASFVVTFADLGFGAALVQRRTLTEDDRSTMFWTSLAAGAVLTGLTAAAAYPMARFYGQPAVRPLFIVLSLSFFVTAIGATQRSLLLRSMDFRRLELRNVAGVVVGAVVGIVSAALGVGAWALIAQSLSIGVVSTILLWLLVPWRPSFRWSKRSAVDLGGFGFRSIGGSLFTILNGITDKLLIGRYLGAAPLGVYALAFSTILVPLSRVVAPIQQVVFPALSRLQDDKASVGAAWLRLNRLVAAICTPLLVGAMVTAPDLIRVVFGDRWAAAVPVLEILGWVSIVQALQGLCPVVLQTLDRPATVFRISIVMFFVSLGAYALGLHWGIVGVATFSAIAATLQAMVYVTVTCRAVSISWVSFCRSLGGVTQAALAMSASMLLVRAGLVHASVDRPVRLVAVLAVGVVVYTAVSLWRAGDLVDEIRAVLAERRGAAQLPPAVEPSLN